MFLLDNIITIPKNIMETLTKLRRSPIIYEGIHRNKVSLIHLLTKETSL